MFLGLRVKNFRAIRDSGHIRLRKINVLLGRNSSGKSTLLRLFPLLRQTVEVSTRGSLLWFGRLVDFGDFSTAQRKGSGGSPMELHFDVNLHAVRTTSARQKDAEEDFCFRRGEAECTLKLQLGRGDEDSDGFVRSLILEMFGEELRVEFGIDGGVEGVWAIGSKIDLRDGYEWWSGATGVVPGLLLIKRSVFYSEDGEEQEEWDPDPQPFSEMVSEALAALLHGNTSQERIASIAADLAYGAPKEFLDRLRALPKLSERMRSGLALFGPDHPHVVKLRRAVLLSKATKLLDLVRVAVGRAAESVRYIAPLRATAERYYRQQNVAVEEVDARGENVAMYLNSLPPWRLRNLQKWMRDAFDFHVEIEANQGHVQVMIVGPDGFARNIADLGFGFSQVLPVLIQLWPAAMDFSRARKRTPVGIIAMEQPELHLHPSYQAGLADLMSSVVSGPGFLRNSLIVETHSDHFVNRLGTLVCHGLLDRDDVQILVVDASKGDDLSVTRVEFDAEGVLGDGWPAGFFSPIFKRDVGYSD